MFKLTLECNNQTKYETEGETILEALNALPLNYVQVKTKGTITITDGERKASRFYPLLGRQGLRALTANKMVKILQAGYLNKILK
mgnify:CR=1 FL=1